MHRPDGSSPRRSRWVTALRVVCWPLLFVPPSRTVCARRVRWLAFTVALLPILAALLSSPLMIFEVCWASGGNGMVCPSWPQAARWMTTVYYLLPWLLPLSVAIGLLLWGVGAQLCRLAQRARRTPHDGPGDQA